MCHEGGLCSHVGLHRAGGLARKGRPGGPENEKKGASGLRGLGVEGFRGLGVGVEGFRGLEFRIMDHGGWGLGPVSAFSAFSQ